MVDVDKIEVAGIPRLKLGREIPRLPFDQMFMPL